MLYTFRNQSGRTFTTESREFAVELVKACKQCGDPTKLIKVTKSPAKVRWSINYINSEGDCGGYEFATRELLNEIAAHRHEFQRLHIYTRGPYPWETINEDDRNVRWARI